MVSAMTRNWSAMTTPVASAEVSAEVDDGARIVADVYGEGSDSSWVPARPHPQCRISPTWAVDWGARASSSRPTSAAGPFDPRPDPPDVQPAGVRTRRRLSATLSVDRCVFLGTSMGGQVAMCTVAAGARRRPRPQRHRPGDRTGRPAASTELCRKEPVADWSEAVRQLQAISEDATPGLTDDEWLRKPTSATAPRPTGRWSPTTTPASSTAAHERRPVGDFRVARRTAARAARASSDILGRETVDHGSIRRCEPSRCPGAATCRCSMNGIAAVDEFSPQSIEPLEPRARDSVPSWWVFGTQSLAGLSYGANVRTRARIDRA